MVALRTSTFTDGNLTLQCGSVWNMVAGTAYLIKLEYDLVNPVFNNVVISDNMAGEDLWASVDFIPTLGRTTIVGDNPNQFFFLGSANTLYHPASLPAEMKGFRGYFKMKGEAASARSFVIDFGNGETTGIVQIDNTPVEEEVYDVLGRRVTKPMQKGVYIINGKKVIK